VKQSYPIRTQLEKAESHFITGLANATLIVHLAATALGLASQYVSDANSPYMESMLKGPAKNSRTAQDLSPCSDWLCQVTDRRTAAPAAR
jgi:hypothetical protein